MLIKLSTRCWPPRNSIDTPIQNLGKYTGTGMAIWHFNGRTLHRVTSAWLTFRVKRGPYDKSEWVEFTATQYTVDPCTSLIQYWMTSDIHNPPSSHIAFCSQWPLKGWSQLLTRSNGEGATSSKGAHLSLLRQRHNMKGNDATVQGKTKHTPT